MYRTFISIIIGIVICGTGARAQDTKTFAFDSSLSVTPPPAVGSFKVLDLREDTGSLGATPRSWWRKSRYTGSKPFAAQLENFGNQLFGNGINPGPDLVLALRSFKVDQEGIYQSAAGAGIHLEASWYLVRDGRYAHLLDTSLFFETYSVRLPAALSKVFYGLAADVASRIPPAAPFLLTMDDVAAARSGQDTATPLLMAAVPHSGVYYTFAEFASNAPGDTAFKQVDFIGDYGNEPEFYKVNSRGKRGDRIGSRDYYAVYNGKKWFLNTPYGPVAMHRAGNDFIFRCEMRALNFQASAPYMGGGVAGAITAMIVYQGNAEFFQEQAAKQARRNGMLGRYEARMNMRNGAVLPMKRLR